MLPRSFVVGFVALSVGLCHCTAEKTPPARAPAFEPVVPSAPDAGATENAEPKECARGTWCRHDVEEYASDDQRQLLLAAWCSSPNDIWVGGHGRLIHYDGKAWQEQATPRGAEVTSLWGAAPNSVFAAGFVRGAAREQVLHFDGSSWTESTLPSPAASHLGFVHRVWGTSSTNVYSVGSRVLRYDGARWSVVQALSQSRFAAIGGSGPNDVYALGNVDAMRFDGQGWKALVPGPGPTLEDFGVTDVWAQRNEVFVTGYSEGEQAYYLHFDGAAWHAVEYVSPLEGLAGRDRNHLYAVGYGVHRLVGDRFQADTRPGAPDPRDRLLGVAVCGDCVVVVGQGSVVSQLCE